MKDLSHTKLPQSSAHRVTSTILLHKSHSSQAALVPREHRVFMEEAYNAAICFKMLRDLNRSHPLHLKHVIRKITSMAYESPNLVLETIHDYFTDNPEISIRHKFRLFQVLETVIRTSDSLAETWEKTFMELALENMTKTTELEDVYQDAASNVLVAICKHSWRVVARHLETEVLTGVFPHRSVLYVLGLMSSNKQLFHNGDQVCWEEQLAQIAAKSVQFLNTDAWSKELLWTLTRPNRTQQEQPPEKTFLFTFYGLILQAAECSSTIRTHLQSLLETSHQCPKQREGMAVTMGLAATRHLDDVWAVLEQFGRSAPIRCSFHSFSPKCSEDYRWKWGSSTILLTYGQMAAKAKDHILPWVDNILSRMIFYFRYSCWDDTLKQSFLSAVLQLVEATSRNDGAHSYEFAQVPELLDCLMTLMEKESPNTLCTSTRQQTIHIISSVCKLRPPPDVERKSRLLSVCFRSVFALPMLEALEKHTCLFLEPPDIQNPRAPLLPDTTLAHPGGRSAHLHLAGQVGFTPRSQHIYVWLSSEKTHERQRAVHSCMTFLKFLSQNLGPDPTEEFKQIGQLVGTLGILCQDPDRAAQHFSLEGLGHLYHLLMHQKTREALKVKLETPRQPWSSGDQKTDPTGAPEHKLPKDRIFRLGSSQVIKVKALSVVGSSGQGLGVLTMLCSEPYHQTFHRSLGWLQGSPVPHRDGGAQVGLRRDPKSIPGHPMWLWAYHIYITLHVITITTIKHHTRTIITILTTITTTISITNNTTITITTITITITTPPPPVPSSPSSLPPNIITNNAIVIPTITTTTTNSISITHYQHHTTTINTTINSTITTINHYCLESRRFQGWGTGTKEDTEVMKCLTMKELTDLIWTAIDGLRSSSPFRVQAAAHLLLMAVQDHGDKLDTVAKMGRAIHLHLCSVRIPQAKEKALQAITLLARSHTSELVAAFLDFSIPLDSHAFQLWRALGTEPPISRLVLATLLTWLQEWPLPPAASDGDSHSKDKAYLRSLAAMNTLHELQFAQEFKAAVQEAYPELFLALLSQVLYILELDLPTEPHSGAQEAAVPSPQSCLTSLEALKSLLSTTGHWNDFAHLELQGAWQLFTTVPTYPQGVGLLARAMVQNRCWQLKAVLGHLLPSLQSIKDHERKVAILILTEFLYSPVLPEVLPKQAALMILAQGLQDPSPEVRVWSLQGLGNILFHPEKGSLLRGQLSPFLAGFFQDSEPVVVCVMGTVSDVLHRLGGLGVGAQSLSVAVNACSFFDDERDGVRASAMALFGDLVAAEEGRELGSLRAQVYQSLVPLLLHFKDHCPAVVMQAKFTFYRCAVLLRWRLRHTLFCTLAWERGLSARNFLWSCLMTQSQEEFSVHLAQALSYLHSLHRHIRTWAALFIGYTICYHPQAVSQTVTIVDTNLLFCTFEDLKKDPDPGIQEFATRQLSFLQKIGARLLPGTPCHTSLPPSKSAPPRLGLSFHPEPHLSLSPAGPARRSLQLCIMPPK
ncbi:PREDICTED: maestro heat-like repeat family member 5 [Chrysochloris asiatica]|uniref:Maestro heat-like repeat family member 5 n=1 Tax=Chrysochloris asiatica TaxID=185453 RepID=A0A9B0WFI2_CHRAS|nr:PREDICTED: maestro heat-like repeat family member 5 [Chrysochloris asiatica]